MRSPLEWPEAKARLLASQYRLAKRDRRPLSGRALAAIVAASLALAGLVVVVAKAWAS